ncbi:MAG TPA: hypothetical protein VHB20_02520 [Verrucomicrobiae bacterium]|jgi:ABC-type Na+ efflux pump permease subunit|nr:hypothetical protein [Verrucomicrobiae bacterium]
MNALLRKELRLILPSGGATLVLAVVPAWFFSRQDFAGWEKGDGGYWMLGVALAFGLVFPALSSFGAEFNLGTFSILLSQPISRRRIWAGKLAALAVVTLAALAAQAGSLVWRFGWSDIVGKLGASSALLALVAVSGGWWSTLLLRQVAAAFWFAVFVPVLLTLTTVAALAGKVTDELGIGCLTVLLGTYAAAGLVAAVKMFTRAQDVSEWGEALAPPSFIGAGANRTAAPWRALAWKEIQLQQASLILGAALAVAHGLNLAARKLTGAYLTNHHAIKDLVEAFPVFWLFVPLVAGSVAVAEERKLGTWESQLCAPVSRGWKFGLKLGAALALSLAGALAGWGLEEIGRRCGVAPGLSWELIPTCGLCAAIGFAAFYASTLSRHTLQALGFSIFAIAVTFGVAELALVHPIFVHGRPLWGGWLRGGRMVGLTVLTLLILGWKNTWQVRFGARLWRWNMLALFTAWIGMFAVNSIIFNRAWEAWMPLEPYHAGELSEKRPRHPSKVAHSEMRTAVVTTQGQLWLQWDAVHRQTPGGGRLEEPARHEFVKGAEWSDVAVTFYKCYALQKDGTLWDVSQTPRAFLPERRWRALASDSFMFTGLARDGSLWRWGMDVNWRRNVEIPVAPEQMGSDTNWISICANQASIGAAAAQANGSIWRWGYMPAMSASKAWSNVMISTPQPWLRLPDRRVAAMAFYGTSLTVIAEDGTLWNNHFGRLTQTGTDQDWSLACYGDNMAVIALKTNGTLWELGANLTKTPLSKYALWTGLTSEGPSILALANDGKLCRFVLPDVQLNAWFSDASWPNDTAVSRLKAVTVADFEP